MERFDPLDVALLVTGSAVVVALALCESYGRLVMALATYTIAWWVLGLEGQRSVAGR